MPVDYRDYPAEWRTVIRPRILARAGDACDWCGVPNGAVIVRRGASWRELQGLAVEAARLAGERPVKIVLTVAHIDHDRTNSTDGNLAALCQKCHLSHDARQHAANARRTRERKLLAREPLLPGF